MDWTVTYLLYDVLSGAVARGLDHCVRLFWWNFMDLDKEHIILSSSSIFPSHGRLLLSLQDCDFLIEVLQQFNPNTLEVPSLVYGNHKREPEHKSQARKPWVLFTNV